MISAVDSSILIDLVTNDPAYADSSERLLAQAFDEGAIVISEVVYAEISPLFDSKDDLDLVVQRLHIRLQGTGSDVAYLAGQRWGEYRRAGGTRTRLLADFLIGAHALIHSERLLTRDRGFFRSYFPELALLER